jgi:hypothetical protein
MLIRGTTIEAFREASLRLYSQRMADYIRKRYPSLASEHPGPGLESLIVRAAKQARGHGIVEGRDVNRYVGLTLAYGAGISSDPTTQALLSNVSLVPAERLAIAAARLRGRALL